jgi:hypothetical protein
MSVLKIAKVDDGVVIVHFTPLRTLHNVFTKMPWASLLRSHIAKGQDCARTMVVMIVEQKGIVSVLSALKAASGLLLAANDR